MKLLCMVSLVILLAGCSHEQRPSPKPSPAKTRADGEQALRDSLAHTNKSQRRK
jgi:hypothetical protein